MARAESTEWNKRMSLTPEEMQARAAHAREIYASVDRERLVRHIVHLFDLEAADEPDEFTYPAFTKPRRQRIFGGQVIAQAMVAAARTVDPGKIRPFAPRLFPARRRRGKAAAFPRSPRFRRAQLCQPPRRRASGWQGDLQPHRIFPGAREGPVAPDPMTGILPPEECWDFADFIAVDPKISDRRIEHMARMHPFEVRAVRPPPSAGDDAI
jgi:acyl-CoA thioesterase-2